MKECDILGGGGVKHTLTPPTYFQGGGKTQDLRPLRVVAGRVGAL